MLAQETRVTRLTQGWAMGLESEIPGLSLGLESQAVPRILAVPKSSHGTQIPGTLGTGLLGQKSLGQSLDFELWDSSPWDKNPWELPVPCPSLVLHKETRSKTKEFLRSPCFFRPSW